MKLTGPMEVILQKRMIAYRQVIRERPLHTSVSVEQMIEQVGTKVVNVLCRTLNRVEIDERSSVTVGDPMVPVTWWDHLKLTVNKRWKTKFKVGMRECAEIDITFSLQRLCPHHSTLANDRHCERFLTREASFETLRLGEFDPVPVFHEYEMQGEKAYKIEVAPDVFHGEAFRDLLRLVTHDHTGLNWADDKPAVKFDHDGPVVFGMPVTVNHELPEGTWRVL